MKNFNCIKAINNINLLQTGAADRLSAQYEYIISYILINCKPFFKIF